MNATTNIQREGALNGKVKLFRLQMGILFLH